MSPVAVKRRKLSDLAEEATYSNGHTESFSSPAAEYNPSQSSSSTKKVASFRASLTNTTVAFGEAQSSLLELELDELIAETVSDQATRTNAIDAALREIKDLIEAVPAKPGIPWSEAKKQLNKVKGTVIKLPGSNWNPSKHLLFAYSKPQNINVVGSYALGTAGSPGRLITVDMSVEIPVDVLQERDYLNYRYYHKRLHYLICLFEGLREVKETDYTFRLDLLNGNQLQPVLLISPKQHPSAKQNFCVRLLPELPRNLFELNKILPTKNAVRSAIETEADTKVTATPFYNSSICADMTISSYLQLLYSVSRSISAFKSASILGRIWLHQRGFSGHIGDGGFGQFEWAVLMAILSKYGPRNGQPILAPTYNAQQLFKATLQFIASRDLVVEPLIYDGELPVRSKGVPMLFDGARGINVLYKTSTWSYNLLRHEAQATLNAFSSPHFDTFDSTFIQKVSEPLQRFDSIFRLKIDANSEESDSNVHPHGFLIAGKIERVLKRALGDRITHVSIFFDNKDNVSTSGTQYFVTVALLLNSSNAYRSVDKGPSAEEKAEATAFRKFWGEKAELRRFKDGSIVESLSWDLKSQQSIIEQIVYYSLQRHLNIKTQNIALVGHGFEKLIPTINSDPRQQLSVYQESQTLFEGLVESIKGFELPLHLRQISATSPFLRYTSLAPLPLKQPAEFVIQFESSGRWPEDFGSIQRMKIALLLRIGDLLNESNNTVVTRVGLENESTDLLNLAFLDIVFPGGFHFRGRIHHERELAILEQFLRSKQTPPYQREEAAAASFYYKKHFVQAPLHNQTIRTLCTRHQFLSGTIRLVKQWFSSHLLANHFSEECIELLVADVFVSPAPWQVPSSLSTGLLRTLQRLARWDWRNEPLIIDFSNELSSSEYEEIRTTFEARRKIDPLMNRSALFIGTNHDPSGVTWTNNAPTKVAATRMTSLAKACCDVVQSSGVEIDPKVLFNSPLDDYDFVLHLDHTVTNGRYAPDQLIKYKNVMAQLPDHAELAGFDVADLFIKELQTTYGSALIFFYDAAKPNIIGGLWNPTATAPQKEWKINLSYSSVPFTTAETTGDSEILVTINKPAILHEIATLGGDIISKIDINR